MPMTPDAKAALKATIQALRARLLTDLASATEATYRLSVRTRDAGLGEAATAKRRRLETLLDEQVRAQSGPASTRRSRKDFLAVAEKQAAYTLLNRLIILRLMEAAPPGGQPIRRPAVATGGWASRGYADFRELAPALVRNDDSEGYAFLLQLVFEDLTLDLPGLFGPAGIADLIPIPAATLRHAVEELDSAELASCWTDDMTLGWVYQYWNDPEREALDQKLNQGGKIEPHEIASKTQLFTERYMVDWLLQNSLGPMWLAMCRKHGWTAEAESDGTLARLEERRIDWRGKRDRGEVSLTDLMPLHTDSEHRWAYYLPQPIPDDAVKHAPDTLRDIKVIDPAVGSGHFLVVLLDLLFALYKEEARHRGVAAESDWSDKAIVERILSHNLHGIDLDPRAIQIAAAALWLKAQYLAPGARPAHLNLVASNLQLASLPDDDPATKQLLKEIKRETGMPPELTLKIVEALRGADHLGSLLRIDRTVDEALAQYEKQMLSRFEERQQELFERAKKPTQAQMDFDAIEVRRSLLESLETFLTRHTRADDLGLRLKGEQLAAGVRFMRIVREGAYDLVVANPPYQGTAKLSRANEIAALYPSARADLYAAFVIRGLELTRLLGVSAMLTLRNWMFLQQYDALRHTLLSEADLRALGDFEVGAFEEITGHVVSVSAAVFRRALPAARPGVALQAWADEEDGATNRTAMKRASALCHQHVFDLDVMRLTRIPGRPITYWWPDSIVNLFDLGLPNVSVAFRVRQGLATGNDTRFLRRPWEVRLSDVSTQRVPVATLPFAAITPTVWAPYIKGAAGKRWWEPLDFIIKWASRGLEKKVYFEFFGSKGGNGVPSEHDYFCGGVVFSTIGSVFSGRFHRFASIFGSTGCTVLGDGLANACALFNSSSAQQILEGFNPTVHFTNYDVERLPVSTILHASDVVLRLERAFESNERAREVSVEFHKPAASPWPAAEKWAQIAVDSPAGARFPEYVENLVPEPATDHLSFATGVALGRFCPNGEGVLDPETADLDHALPNGILFLDRSLDADDLRDSLGHPAAKCISEAWSNHEAGIERPGTIRGVRDWLALRFFRDVHLGMYESRPIHWPLSSERRTFVAWVNIHRFNAQTLRHLLADHLYPTLTRLEGELADVGAARGGGDRRAARAAEDRFADLRKHIDELKDFIAKVEQCADKGPPPTEAGIPAREQDAVYDPDLDDGVMINSAALWPLLHPQWSTPAANCPKRWWKYLATARGRQDFDWSHLAMRYWPTRVDEKCKADPSLAVAHGCFWRYHPARAWAWELRLQSEIGPQFRIEEKPYTPGGRDVGDSGDGPHRDAWIRDHAEEALEAIESEATRRMGRGAGRTIVESMTILESSLWQRFSKAIWDLEIRLSQRQGAEFRLLSPDEPASRKAYEESDPAAAKDRARMMSSLEPVVEMFADDDEQAEDDVDEGGDELDEVAAGAEDDE
jgi:hypothetical protein